MDTTPRYKNDNQTGQFGNQRAVNVAGARETIGGQVVQQSGIQCFNCKEFGHYAKECIKPKRVKDSTYHKEKTLMCKQAEKVTWQRSRRFLMQNQHDAEPLETGDSNVIPDSPDMCDNDIQDGQNDVECDDERVELANSIANLKLDVDENKKIQKQLKKANATLTQELTECKSILAETSRTLGESNKIVNQAWVKHSNDLLHLRNPTAQDMEILVKTCLMPLALKTQNDSFAFVHELKQEMHADLKYVESLEDELDELESDKAEFSNMYDMLLQECVSKDVMCSYLQSSSDLDEITELQCLYLHKVRECDCLAQKLSEQTEFVSKEIYTELLQSFAKLEKHSISLEIALQECQEQLKNDTVCKEKASNVFRKEREQYFEIQDLKAQLQDKNIAISELKKLIEKCKGKSVDTKFDKPSVVRQPNAQRIPKPSVLGKPAPFSDSLERKYFAKKKSVLKTNESEGLSKPVTPQNLPQKATQAVRNTNVIKPGMYRIASRVTHNTNVSRPQPRSNQTKDKVVPNTSHVKFKKTEVEEHPRISSISNQTKSVTACNNSLKSRTLNVNAVCATCGKCVFNLNHDACVSKFLNDVNARTKKPNIVPISTRKPKSQANKSVATPHKKIVASESTITNSKSYYRMLYKQTSKVWKWWIAQQCLLAYTWVPKTKRKWVPKVRNASVTKKIVQLILFIFDSGCTKHMTRITPSGLTEGERGFEQTKRCYLTEVIPFFKTLKEHFVGVQKALFKEVKEMEEIFDQMNNEVDKNTVDKQCAEIEKKNLLIENENLIVNCLSTQLLYDVEKSRCLDLEADMSKVHDESKLISKLEREYLNLQLKYQHLQESFDNKNSQASQEAPDFNSFFKIKNLEHQIKEKDNVIRHLKDLVASVNNRSREPHNAITRAHTSEKTSTMLNEIESLKAQLRSKEPCFTSDYVKPKVLAPGMYAIDVKPIPHPLKNNRSAHVMEIVEEARVVKPLNNALNYACQYTKLSQDVIPKA
ncbi:retrovirus-related pol polyprotein from transposon TNT 1-94 [Tanacetum coccineum]